MNTIRVPAPAKLNLFLHVTGRRPDGYHTLESLMVCVDHCDVLTLTRRADGAIVRTNDVAGVPADADLGVRAARALREATASPFGVEIAVDKRIPMGAGLGGGSSDAASVLLALNRLWGLGLARDRLRAIGATLGADVPFFLFGHPAIARGIGDELTAVSIPRRWAAIVVAPVVASTAAIFAAFALTPGGGSAKMDVISEGYGQNALQPVAVARFPEIAAAVAGLRAHSTGARMTGSGSGVFALFDTEAAARAACQGARAFVAGARVFVARTLELHPLAEFG